MTELAKRSVNLILLSPPLNNILELLNDVFLKLGFELEISSSNQSKWLYSRREIFDWYILLFPYTEERVLDLRQYLPVASETILCLYDEHCTNFAVVQRITRENRDLQLLSPLDTMPHFDRATANWNDLDINARWALDAIAAAVKQLKNSNQELEVSACQMKCPSESTLLRQYLQHRLLHARETTTNIYICFKYDKACDNAPFSQVSEIIHKTVSEVGVPVDSFHVHNVVNGSIVAYILCQSSMLWLLVLQQHKLFIAFKEQKLELRSIYEATISDINASMAREDNAPYYDKLVELKTMMIKDGAKQGPEHRW